MTTIARLSATIIADAASGRWVLSTGAACLTAIEGINDGKPIELVVDLATLRIPGKALILLDHTESIGQILGTWSGMRVEPLGTGLALTAAPSWIDLPPAPIDGAVDVDGWRRSVLSIIAQGIPLQASVGVVATGEADSGFRKLLQPETINGREVEPAQAGQPPMYIGSNLELREGSVVLFGADTHTGAILRQMLTTNPEPKEITMPAPEISFPERMKALLARHPKHKALLAEAVADGKDDAAIAAEITTADMSALSTALEAMTVERDKMQTTCATLEASVASLTKAVADLGGKLPSGAGEEDETTAAPANMAEAMTRHRAELAGKPMLARLSFLRSTYPTLA